MVAIQTRLVLFGELLPNPAQPDRLWACGRAARVG
jgi:hypothetical protein